MMSHGAVHIGTDSEAFVKKANYYLNMITKHGNRCINKKHWKLISDGDLWEHFYKAALKKGAQSIRPSWVKGHATQKHIDKGITTEINMKGNDKADATADIGTKLFGEDLMQVASSLHLKHRLYQNFMFDVGKHIIEAYVIHRQLCDHYEEKKGCRRQDERQK